MAGAERVSWIWPAAGISLSVALGMAHWAFGSPGGLDALPIGPFVMAGLWGYIEWRMSREDPDRPEAIAIHNTHRVVFAGIGLYAAIYSGLSLAADWTVPDAAWKPVARRGVGALGGAMLAVWGNHLPKLLSPWRLEDEPFDWQGVHRLVGWLAALGGVAIVVSWVALPLAEAAGASRVVVATMFVLALGTKFLSLATHRPAAG